jgi:competence protein ComEC
MILILYMAEKVKRRYIYLGIFALCAGILFHLPKPLTITCLSVGQGDSAVIEYKDLVCIIDAGSSSEREVASYTLLPFLKYRGIREIDYLILTHADSDHINAVGEILKQSPSGIKVRKIVVSDGRYLEEYGEIPVLAKEYGISIYEMKQNDRVTLGEVSLQCLAPSRQFLEQNRESNNDSSMVLLLRKDRFQMLFTGDVEGEGEERLNKALKDEKISDIDVLKVAHHGSKYSNSMTILNTLRPEYAVVSAGVNNWYGHPHADTLERLEAAECKVWNTAEYGQVTIDNRGVEIYLKSALKE